MTSIKEKLPDEVGNKNESVHVHGPNCNHHKHEALKPITRESPKIGRNDPCLCGSQKKYKKCCGA